MNKYYEQNAFKKEWVKDFKEYKLYYLYLILVLAVIPIITFIIGYILEIQVLTIISIVVFAVMMVGNYFYMKKFIKKYLLLKQNIIFSKGISLSSYYPIYFSINENIVIKDDCEVIFKCSKHEFSHVKLMIDYSKDLNDISDTSKKDTIYSFMIYKKNEKKPFVIDINVFYINHHLKKYKSLFILSTVKCFLDCKKTLEKN